MPKVNYRKAAKDYPQFGISKGDIHYVWSMKTGPRSSVKRRQLERPRASQLTSSGFKQQAHGINESMEDSLSSNATFEDMQAAVEEAKSEAENLRDETQDSLDNMPEGLQQGPTGELLQERIDALEAYISELEDWENQWDEPDEDNEEEWLEEALEALKAFELDVV